MLEKMSDKLVTQSGNFTSGIRRDILKDHLSITMSPNRLARHCVI
jgi:hypothetical protein